MVKLFVICKNKLLIQTIKSGLEKKDIKIVEVCTESSAALEQLKTLDVDIVMTDVNWHYYKVSGIALIKDILSYKPDIKIIGVTLVYEEKVAEELQQLGVTGYIYRSVGSIDKIVDCIERVHIGERYFIE